MSIETRMDEFQKVADKVEVEKESINERMNEFETTEKKNKKSSKRASALPYGLKEHRPCPFCGEHMTISEVKENEAEYICQNCKKQVTVTLNG